MTMGALADAVRRHPWTTALDATVLGIVMMVGVLLALEYEIVVFWDQMSERQRRIRMEEIFLLSVLLAAGLGVFAFRRMKEALHDKARELKAEAETAAARKLALQDPLTALPNRRALEQAIDKAVARPPADGGMHAFYLLDLNGFKQVNDQQGHAAGDEVLKIVAKRFRAAARSEDLVARLGGDEFAMLACDIESRELAVKLGERFVSALLQEITVGGRAYPVGVSVGVALYPQDASTAGEVMHRADIAMYKAKAAKRSGVHVFKAA